MVSRIELSIKRVQVLGKSLCFALFNLPLSLYLYDFFGDKIIEHILLPTLLLQSPLFSQLHLFQLHLSLPLWIFPSSLIFLEILWVLTPNKLILLIFAHLIILLSFWSRHVQPNWFLWLVINESRTDIGLINFYIHNFVKPTRLIPRNTLILVRMQWLLGHVMFILFKFLLDLFWFRFRLISRLHL